jgi:hypothetical protein
MVQPWWPYFVQTHHYQAGLSTQEKSKNCTSTLANHAGMQYVHRRRKNKKIVLRACIGIHLLISIRVANS